MSIFFAMLAGMSDPARRLSGEFSNIQQAVAAADRVYEVLDREPTIVDPPNPVALPPLDAIAAVRERQLPLPPGQAGPPRRQPGSPRRRNDRHRRPQRLRQDHARCNSCRGSTTRSPAASRSKASTSATSASAICGCGSASCRKKS